VSQAKGFRRLESLTPSARARHDAIARTVRWRTLLTFAREATDDPKDHGEQPYEPGRSLMDRERRGEFTVQWAPSWNGALTFTVDDGIPRMGAGGGAVTVMLDRQQCYLLLTGLLRWIAGTVAGWSRKPLRAYGVCPTCGGTGYRVSEG